MLASGSKHRCASVQPQSAAVDSSIQTQLQVSIGARCWNHCSPTQRSCNTSWRLAGRLYEPAWVRATVGVPNKLATERLLLGFFFVSGSVFSSSSGSLSVSILVPLKLQLGVWVWASHHIGGTSPLLPSRDTDTAVCNPKPRLYTTVLCVCMWFSPAHTHTHTHTHTHSWKD